MDTPIIETLRSQIILNEVQLENNLLRNDRNNENNNNNNENNNNNNSQLSHLHGENRNNNNEFTQEDTMEIRSVASQTNQRIINRLNGQVRTPQRKIFIINNLIIIYNNNMKK